MDKEIKTTAEAIHEHIKKQNKAVEEEIQQNPNMHVYTDEESGATLEKIPFMFYDIEETNGFANKYFTKTGNFNKTNIIMDGHIPYPYKFELYGVSVHIIGTITDEDHEILDSMILMLCIAHKRYFQRPLKTLIFDNLTFENVEQAYKEFYDNYVDGGEYTEEQKAKLHLVMSPLSLKGYPIIIPSRQQFEIDLYPGKTEQKTSKPYLMTVILHGILHRPIL